MTVLLFAAVEAAASGGKQPPPDPRYAEECGTCHAPYPARLLPASSWRALLAGLDRHFDSDASLEPDAQREIQAYLEQGARREPNPPPAQPLLRITEKEHRKRSGSEAKCDAPRVAVEPAVLLKSASLSRVKTKQKASETASSQ